MLTERCLFALVAADGFLYAIGGRNEETPLASAEKYNAVRDVWVTVRPMSMPRVAAAATALNHRIFVIGGATENNCCETASVECFDCKTETWTKVEKDFNI